MIFIQDVGPHGEADSGGLRHYEVRINHGLIARFDHHRREGLAVCLRRRGSGAGQAGAGCLQGGDGEPGEVEKD